MRDEAHPPLTQAKILQTWWPLAASWLLMGLELPILSAVVARMADPTIHLAAYGGIVFPLALLIESPVIMLLAASTALCRDWATFLKLRRFMHGSGLLLSGLHVLLAFTPLYDVLVVAAFAPPPDVVEPARLGLMIMTPWTWAIAYRRFHQGVLIRHGRARAVTQGTLVRLVALCLVLGVGFVLREATAGIVAAAGAIALAVSAEAAFVGWRVRPVLRGALRRAPPVDPPLTAPAFTRFYVPLFLTSLLGLLMMPLGTAAIGRLPDPLNSLAVWPVVGGLQFLLLSVGMAFNEVVLALLDLPGAAAALRRFAWTLSLTVSGTLLVFLSTPLADLWFRQLTGLDPVLAALAKAGLWWSLPRPALATLQNWYQGAIIHGARTRAITEAVVVFLALSAALLGAGIGWQVRPGVVAAQFAFAVGALAQVVWLAWRSRPVLAALAPRP